MQARNKNRSICNLNKISSTLTKHSKIHPLTVQNKQKNEYFIADLGQEAGMR